MAHRLVISTPKVDKVLKRGLFSRKFNRFFTQLQVQPIYIELKYIFSAQELPPKRFYKSSGRKEHNKSYLLSGGRITDTEKSSELAWKNKRRILVIGTAANYGVCWVGARKSSKKDFNTKGSNNCVNQCTPEKAQMAIKVERKNFATRLDGIPLSIVVNLHVYLRLHSNNMGPKQVRSAWCWFAFAVFLAAFNAFNNLAEEREVLMALARKSQVQIKDFVSGLRIQKNENLGMTEYFNPLLWNYIID